MIPSKMLSICSSVISRPNWEYLLKIFLVIGVSVAVVASGLMAYVEAGSIVSSTVLATVRVVPGGSDSAAGRELKETTSKLDLKAVYDKVENRFKRNNTKDNCGKSVQSSSGSNSNGSNSLIVSKSGGSAMVNGTGVLSSNNNSTLRNRRGGGAKKSSDQQQHSSTSLTSASSKLFDKSNNQKSSSPSVEDITCGPSSSTPSGFSKKNKENSPGTVDSSTSNSASSGKKKKGGGGGVANTNATSSTPLSSTATNAQVNCLSSGTSKKKQNRSSGSSGSLTNVELVENGCVKSMSKAEQEETSSTTTESSNSDDFYVPPASDKKLSGYLTQRKESRTNSPENNGCTGTSHSVSSKGKKDGSNKKSKSADVGKLGDGEILGLMDGLGTMMSKGGGSPLNEDISSTGSAKKKSGRRKDQTNIFGIDNVPGKFDGKTSPGALPKLQQQHHPGHHHFHHDMAMWDSPQRPLGDGLSELAAQTEAFVMHRPGSSGTGKKSNSVEHLMNQATGSLGRNSHSPPMPHGLQMPGYPGPHQQMHLGGNLNVPTRHRRHQVGIIGQRYGPQLASNLIAPGFYQNGPSRQHNPPARMSNSSMGLNPAGSGWTHDILPDNGCDIWSRKGSLDGNPGPSNNVGSLGPAFPSVASSSTSELPPMYSSGNMIPPGYTALFDGFPTSSSPGLSNRSSDDGGYYSLGSAAGNNGAAGTMVSSSAVSAGRNPSARNSGDSSQLFNYNSMEIFNNLNLPLSSVPYDMSLGYRSTTSTSTAPIGRNAGASLTSNTGATPHNYLQRMRSEPPTREDGRGFGTSSSKCMIQS